MDTKIKILILSLFTAFNLFGQSPLSLAVRYNITSATGGDPYTVVGVVSDDLSRFTGSDIAIGDSLYVIDGSDLYVLKITAINSVVGPTVNLTADDPSNAGISLPTGQSAIVRPTPNYKLPIYISGLRDDLRSMMMNRQAKIIDQITGGGVASITDFISAGQGVPPSALASSNGGETWRNMTTGELWRSDGGRWHPFVYDGKECQDTVLVSAITVQSGGSVTTGSPLIRSSGGVWQHMYNHPSGTNLIPDGVITDIITGPKAIIQYCGVRKGSGATPNTSYYVDQTANTGFTTTLPTVNIRPLGKVASNGDFLINAGLTFSRVTASNFRDSSLVRIDGTYNNKRITDNLYKNGTLGVGTNDTTGRLNIRPIQSSKPGTYTILRGTGYRLYGKIRNPSAGWNNANKNDWYEGAINNGTSQNGSNNFTVGAVTDTLPNVVWRRGMNFVEAPSMYESDETNWWGSGFLGSNLTAPRNVFEKHWQIADSSGVEHRPLTGYFEKRAGGYGSLGFNVSLAAFLGWNNGQDAILTVNRNSETRFGQVSFFNDSLYTLNLSNLQQNSVLHLAAANKSGAGDPTGRSNFLTIGGNGSFNNVIGIGALYTNSNNGGDLDAIFTTQTSSTQVERMRIKGGANQVSIGGLANPLQTLDINGTTLHRGGVRVNMVGDSSALTLKYASTQTSPVFKVQNNAGTDLFWQHSYNTTNPSLVFGKIGSVNATSPNNTVFGLTSVNFTAGAGNNTLFGFNTGGGSYNGYENTHIGSGAGRNTTDGFQNTFIGYLSGGNNTTGYQNMFLGRNAGSGNTTGAANVLIGASAGATGTTQSGNVSIGTQAGQANNGTNNVYVGTVSGRLNTGSGNVFVGASTGEVTTSTSNTLIVDNSNTTTPLLKGDFANDTLRVFGRIFSGLSSLSNTDRLFTIQNGLGLTSFYRTAASPNSVVIGTRGDLNFMNTGTLGSLWVKVSGANTNTGWEQVVTTSGTSTSISTMMREESFTATASQTTFTIAYSAPAVSGTSVPIRVYRNGVRLFYVASAPTSTQFTYSGTTVTTIANTAGDVITIEYLN